MDKASMNKHRKKIKRKNKHKKIPTKSKWKTCEVCDRKILH